MVKAGDKLPRSRLIETTVFLNYNFWKPRDNVLSDFQTWFCREHAWCTVHPKQIFAKGRKKDRREDNLSICSLLHLPHSQVSTTHTDFLSLETSLNEHFIKRGLSSIWLLCLFLSFTIMFFNFIHFCAWKIIFISENIPSRVMHHDIYQLINICVGSTFRRIWHR